jgi:hypothetical protein
LWTLPITVPSTKTELSFIRPVPGKAAHPGGIPSFAYQAQSWNKPRHVVAKVEWHPGELYSPPFRAKVVALLR